MLIESALEWETFPTQFVVEFQFPMGVTVLVQWWLGTEIFITFGTFNNTMVLFVVDVQFLYATKYLRAHFTLNFLRFGVFETVSLGRLEPSVSTCNVASLFTVILWSTSKALGSSSDLTILFPLRILSEVNLKVKGTNGISLVFHIKITHLCRPKQDKDQHFFLFWSLTIE